MYTNNKLLKLIENYGLIDIEPILENIENYYDLCIFGKAFIENKLYRHIDYLAMFGKSNDSNGHNIVTENLIQLHQFGIITRDGQINTIQKEDKTIIQQRSYLSIYCKKEVSNKIISELLLDNRIFTVIYTSDNHIIHNVPKEEIIRNKMINVTRSSNASNEWNNCTNIWFDNRESYCYYYNNSSDSEEDEEENSIDFNDFILNNCLYITLIYKEYKKYEHNEDVSSILLEIVKNCGIEQIIE